MKLAFQVLNFLFLFSCVSEAQNNFGFHEILDLPVIGNKQAVAIQATAALYRRSDLYPTPIKFGEAYNFCEPNKYAQQPMFSHCTGTLISDRQVLTAGHCLRSEDDCASIELMFDYTDEDSLSLINKNKTSQIYKCKKVLKWSQPIPQKNLVDYAIIELDRPVKDRLPISIKPNSSIHHFSKNIFSLGHPKGLPLKIFNGFLNDDDLTFNEKNIEESFWRAHMNSFEGLSGAAIYNANFDIIGILVRGDANIYKEDRCLRIKPCDQSACPWIEIQKLNFNSDLN